MGRPTSTLDPFEALAQPRRRQVMETLARYQLDGCCVNQLVVDLELPQPVVSKHLAVLKEVGLVSFQQRGKQRIYQVNGEGVRAIHAWAARFEKFWTQQLGSIKERAEKLAERRARELKSSPSKSQQEHRHDQR